VADRFVSQGREHRDRESDRHNGQDVVPVHVLAKYTGLLAIARLTKIRLVKKQA
jgi:hypothetical protein